MLTHEIHRHDPKALVGVVLICGLVPLLGEAFADQDPGRVGAAAEDQQDRTPPASVGDLASDTGLARHDAITLNWTATGDDGTYGTASNYDVRYRTDEPITDENWDSATQAFGEPPPQPAGSPETFTVTDLSPDTTYHLALKVSDESGNTSGLSNVVTATTDVEPPPGWDVENADGSVNVAGGDVQLMYDAAGNPAISYEDGWGGNENTIRFARHDGVAWNIETVTSGRDPDFAFDPATGRPMISYRIDGNVMLARFNGTTWDFETVATEPLNGQTSLAFDGAGHPAISYRHQVTAGPPQDRGNFLRLARFDGASWVIENVDSDAGTPYEQALAFDAAGNPAIVYGTDFSGQLKFARYNGSSWDIETLDTSNLFVDLVFDPVTGDPSIVYTDNSWNVKFAQHDGSSWNIEIIDTCGGCHAGALVFDASGLPHVAYLGPDSVNVAGFTGVDWSIDLVEGAIDPTVAPSFAFDFDGNGSVAYDHLIDSSNGRLRFAREPVP
jgi:hypothetical protein